MRQPIARLISATMATPAGRSTEECDPLATETLEARWLTSLGLLEVRVEPPVA